MARTRHQNKNFTAFREEQKRREHSTSVYLRGSQTFVLKFPISWSSTLVDKSQVCPLFLEESKDEE